MAVSHWLRRPLPAAAVLLVLYLLLSGLMDPDGYLGTDTGAKVATLEAMDRQGTARPDVGYWAEELDPDGIVHPLYQTRLLSDGAWVNVTTLPMLELARPLYALGGYRAALLIPMLAGVGSALAVRWLARIIRPGSEWWAFWVTGAASPVLLYSLDLWEHVIGVALVVTAVSLLVTLVHREGQPWRALLAGALLGLAATMRTEALVYTLVAVAVACVTTLVQRRQPLRAVSLGLAAVIGFATVWAGNVALERAVGGLSRASRASGTAGSAARDLSSAIGQRASEALVTTLGMKGDSPASWLMGVGAIALLAVAWRGYQRGERPMVMLGLGGTAAVYLLSAIADLSFVPGMIPACPVILGLAFARPRDEAATVVVIALASLPLVWAFQFVGAAGPQWGGRYMLPSSVLLATVAMATLAEHPEARRVLVGLTALVTVIGVTWMAVRTRSVDTLFDDLRDVDADVLIVRDAFLLREGGPAVLDEPWLTAAGEEQFALATQVAADAGASTVAVLELGSPAPPPSVIPEGWTEQSRDAVDLAGDPIGLVVYQLP